MSYKSNQYNLHCPYLFFSLLRKDTHTHTHTYGFLQKKNIIFLLYDINLIIRISSNSKEGTFCKY
jgi:hypothetical protein